MRDTHEDKRIALQRAEHKLAPLAKRYRNTRLESCGATATLWLYRTPIVTVHYGGLIQLNTGGHETATTKRRMNEALHALGADFTVYQEDFAWKVWNWKASESKGDYLDHQHYRTDGVAVPSPY